MHGNVHKSLQKRAHDPRTHCAAVQTCIGLETVAKLKYNHVHVNRTYPKERGPPVARKRVGTSSYSLMPVDLCYRYWARFNLELRDGLRFERERRLATRGSGR